MILVIGGGVIGAAVARVAARTGAVMVGSLTPRPHVGLWFRFDLTKDTIPAGLPPDARIIVAVGGAEPGAVRALAASTTIKQAPLFASHISRPA